MIFLADENIPRQTPRLLEAFDTSNEVHAFEDCFERGTKDIDWMKKVRTWPEEPAILCGDGRILKNKVEVATLKDCDLHFVYLSSGWTQLPWPIFAWKIIKAWPGIVSNVEHARRATVFEVKPGNLKIEQRSLVADL